MSLAMVINLWKAAIEALPTIFDVTASEMVMFVEGMNDKPQELGWSKGFKQITTFKNDAGVNINLIKQYVITGVNKETRACKTTR